MSQDESKLTYNAAMAQIRQLTSEIESLDGDLDSLVNKVKELKVLILHCENKVMEAEGEIRDIFDEEEE
jgi:exonuclease VII small subunit